jgi:hypothetical protein
VSVPGDEAVLLVVVDELALLLGLLAAGLLTVVVVVVLLSVFFSAGVTFSDFCSHAAKSAAPARMQIYFFMVFRCRWQC